MPGPTQQELLIHALRQFAASAIAIKHIWEKDNYSVFATPLTRDYPEQWDSFDEVVIDASRWARLVEAALLNPPAPVVATEFFQAGQPETCAFCKNLGHACIDHEVRA